MTAFYIYAICFDDEVYGFFATRAEAEDDLKRQIETAGGGPAWDGCRVERVRINGEPEIA